MGLLRQQTTFLSSNETAADRIRATKQAIEDKRDAATQMEAALSGTLLPTLDELIATMAEEEEQTIQTTTANRHLGIIPHQPWELMPPTQFTTAMGRIRDQFAQTREASLNARLMPSIRLGTGSSSSRMRRSWQWMRQVLRLRGYRRGNGKAKPVCRRLRWQASTTLPWASSSATQWRLIEAVGRDKSVDAT